MTIEKRTWHKRALRKSSMVSEKQTEKKHEAVKRYLFQMSEIPWEPHKKRQRTASRRRRPAEGERHNTCVEASDQPHVRRGHKDKSKKEKTRGKLKRGHDKEIIQEGRNANAEFVDLLVLAKSAALLETKGMRNVDKPRDATDTIGSAQAKKHALRHVDKSMDANGRIGNAQAEKDAFLNFDKLLDATDRIDNAQAEKDALHDVDKSLDASERIGNAQAGKDASRMKGRSHRSHFRHQALMYLGLEISRSIQEDEHADLEWVEDKKIDDSANADQVEGEMCVQDVPDLCVATERGPKGLEGVRKQASLVEAVTTNPRELQPCVKRNKIIPQAVRMTANFGDSRGQSDVCLWRKDAYGNMNGLLKENIPKPSQEHGHAPPNCQTEPSLTHMPDAENWKQSIIMHNSELLAIQMAESLKEGPSAARQKRMQRTLERRKLRSGNPQPIVQQPGVTSRYILPRATQMAPEHGDRMEKDDGTRQLAKATTSKLNGLLQEKNLKTQPECGHAPIVLQAGVTSRYVLPRTGRMEKGDVPLQLAKDTTTKLNGSLQEKNLEAQQECGHAPTVLQPGVTFRYILPRTAQMAPEHGYRMQKGDVTHQLAKDTTAKLNGSLQQKNFKTQQERGHAPIVLQPGVTSRCILPRTAQMAPKHGDPMQKGDVTRQLGTDTSAKFNGFLQEKNSKTQQERGNAPTVLQPGVTSRYILPRTAQMAPEHGDRMEKGDVTRKPGKDTTAKLNGSLQEKNLKTQQECGHARIVLQPSIKSRYILPRTAQLSPKHGDCMEQSNLTHQLAKDTTAKMNGSLQVNNPNSQQECGHAPFNCETEPSSKDPSAALESSDSVALDGEKQKRPIVSQMPKSPNHNVIAHLRQMLRSVEQWTQPRQKTHENWKRKDAADFESFRATRNYERLKAQQVQGAIHLQDTQDLRVATERGPKGLEGIRKQASLVEAATTNAKELQPCVEPDEIIPWAVRMTADIGDCKEQSDACLRRKDGTGNMNGSLNEYNPKPPQEHEHAPPNCQIKPSLTRISNPVKVNGSLEEKNLKTKQECGHAPLNCETEPSRIHLSETLESRDSVPLEDIRSDERVEAQQVRGAIHLKDAEEAPVIAKSGSDKIVDIRKQASKLDPVEGTNENSGTCGAHQLTEDLYVATERGHKGLEGVRKQAYLVEVTNTKELQRCAEPEKIIPRQISPFLEWLQRAVRMTAANIGDSREKSDACILTKDRTGDCMEQGDVTCQLAEDTTAKVNLEGRVSFALKDTRCDERVEARQVRGAIHLHDTQEPPVIAKRGSDETTDLRKQASKSDPMEVTNVNSAPCDAHLTEDLCFATKRAPKGLEGVKKQTSLVGGVTKNTKELQPCVERDKIVPQAVRMTGNIGDSREQSDACCRRKDRTGNVNGQLNENNPKFPQEHGHAPPKCQTDPSLTQMSDAVEDPDSDLLYIEKWKRQSLIWRSESLAIKLAELLKEGPSVARQKRMLRISERRKQRSKNSHPIVLQPSTAQMSPEHGDCMEQDDVTHQLAEDATAKVNGSLQENNLKTQEECIHGPLNCETEPSRIHLSEALEDRDSAAQDIRSDERVEAQQVRGEIHLQDTQEPPVIGKGGFDELAAIRKQASMLDPMEVNNEHPVPCDAQQLTEDTSVKDDCELISCGIRGEKRKHAENEDFAIRGGSPERLATGQLPELLKETARDKRMRRTMIRRKQRNGDICDIAKSGFDEPAAIRKQATMLDPMEVTNENPVTCDVQQLAKDTSSKDGREIIPCEIREEKRKHAEDEDFAIRRERPKGLAIDQLPELLKQIARDKRMLRIMVRRKQRNGVAFPATDDLNFTRTMARHQRKLRRLIRLKRRYCVEIPATAELHMSQTNGVPPPSIMGRLSNKKGVEVPAMADLHRSQTTGVEVPATADLHRSQTTGVEVPATADLHRSQTNGVEVPATADLHRSQATGVEVPAMADLHRSQTTGVEVPAMADLHRSQTTGVEVPATADLYRSQTIGVEVPATADLRRSQTNGVSATADLHRSTSNSLETQLAAMFSNMNKV